VVEDGCVGPNGILSVITASRMGIFVTMSAGLRTERGELCFSARSPAWGSREREFRVIQVESCFCRAFGRVSHITDYEAAVESLPNALQSTMLAITIHLANKWPILSNNVIRSINCLDLQGTIVILLFNINSYVIQLSVH
jgi:hypothetical protein